MITNLDPESMQNMVANAAAKRMPAALEEATEELVSALAQAQVAQHFRPLMGQLVDTSLAKAQRPKLEQSVGPVEVGGDVRLDGDERPRGGDPQPKALLFDPFTALDQLGFRERPTAITYQTLGQMARRIPPFTAIVQTRINQMAAFTRPQPDEFSVGFKIALRDKSMEMTPELAERAKWLTRYVSRCGNPDVRVRRDKFGVWMRKTVWDSLVYDQIATEVVPDRRGRPSYWRAIDAATIRISDDLDEMDDDENTIQYLQVYDDTIIAEFTESELMFGVRNPRTDIKLAGYGVPELEMLITIVTAILWGIDYNANFFKQGTVAKGIINFKGAIPDRELESFRRNWYSMLSGVDNAWRTPIVNAEDLSWVNMQSSNRDMEFASWIDWLLKVTCAVCQIAPEEIGFQFGNSGQTSTLSEGNQGEKLAASKDKGLIPLATFIGEELDENVIEPLDPRFTLQLAGLSAKTAEQVIELQTKEVKTLKTVDEIRAERDLDPLPGGKGEVILDPTWLQFAQAKDQGGEGPDGLDRMGLDQAGDDEQDEQPDEQAEPPGPPDEEQPPEDGVEKSFKRSILSLDF